MTDISILTTQLLTVAGIVKVVIDLLKIGVSNRFEINSNHKFVASLVTAVVVTVTSGISLLDTADANLFYVGSVGAGLVAGLGSNFIHEFMKVLQTIKSLKK